MDAWVEVMRYEGVGVDALFGESPTAQNRGLKRRIDVRFGQWLFNDVTSSTVYFKKLYHVQTLAPSFWISGKRSDEAVEWVAQTRAPWPRCTCIMPREVSRSLSVVRCPLYGRVFVPFSSQNLNRSIDCNVLYVHNSDIYSNGDNMCEVMRCIIRLHLRRYFMQKHRLQCIRVEWF